jgi:hypothetical protein
MSTLNDIAFQYWTGNNPINGASIYADVTIQEISIHYGINWNNLNDSEKEEIRQNYNL